MPVPIHILSPHRPAPRPLARPMARPAVHPSIPQSSRATINTAVLLTAATLLFLIV